MAWDVGEPVVWTLILIKSLPRCKTYVPSNWLAKEKQVIHSRICKLMIRTKETARIVSEELALIVMEIDSIVSG